MCYSIPQSPLPSNTQHIFLFYLSIPYFKLQVGEVMTLCRKQKQTTPFQVTEIYYLHIVERLKSTRVTKQFEGTSNFLQLMFGVHFRFVHDDGLLTYLHRTGFVCTAHLLISFGYICREGDGSIWQAFRFASGCDCNNFRVLTGTVFNMSHTSTSRLF